MQDALQPATPLGAVRSSSPFPGAQPDLTAISPAAPRGRGLSLRWRPETRFLSPDRPNLI